MTKIPIEAIRLAISGGWEPSTGLTADAYLEADIWKLEYEQYKVALDREFWVALFPIGECHCGKDGHPLNSVNCPEYKWKYSAIQFVDIILSGQDPTEFWAGLIAKDN